MAGELDVPNAYARARSTTSRCRRSYRPRPRRRQTRRNYLPPPARRCSPTSTALGYRITRAGGHHGVPAAAVPARPTATATPHYDILTAGAGGWPHRRRLRRWSRRYASTTRCCRTCPWTYLPRGRRARATAQRRSRLRLAGRLRRRVPDAVQRAAPPAAGGLRGRRGRPAGRATEADRQWTGARSVVVTADQASPSSAASATGARSPTANSTRSRGAAVRQARRATRAARCCTTSTLDLLPTIAGAAAPAAGLDGSTAPACSAAPRRRGARSGCCGETCRADHSSRTRPWRSAASWTAVRRRRRVRQRARPSTVEPYRQLLGTAGSRRACRAARLRVARVRATCPPPSTRRRVPGVRRGPDRGRLAADGRALRARGNAARRRSAALPPGRDRTSSSRSTCRLGSTATWSRHDEPVAGERSSLGDRRWRRSVGREVGVPVAERAEGAPERRAWRARRRARRRCPARTARRSWASASGSRPGAGLDLARQRHAERRSAPRSASSPMTTTIRGCTTASSSSTRARHSRRAMSVSGTGHLTNTVP